MAENAEQNHRQQLPARLDALWAMLANRGLAQPAPLRDCWRLTGELQSLAQRSGMPAFAQMLRRLASSFAHRAGDGTPLGFDETVDLAAWCETAALGIREGLSADELTLLFLIDEVPWLQPWEPATRAAVRRDLPAEFSARPQAPEAAVDPSLDAELQPDSRAATRAQLQALGVDVDGLEDADLDALAEVMLAEQAPESAQEPVEPGPPPAAPAPAAPVLEDQAPATVAIEAARQMLEAQGVDIEDLSAEDLLALAEAFGAGDLTDPEDTAELMLGDAATDSLAQPSADELTVDTPAAESAAGEQTIWIANEELELTRGAISDQVMPLVLALVDAADEPARVRARDDLGYQLGLIGNAMEIFGVPSLFRLLGALSAHCAGPAPDGEALLRISAALLSYLDTADLDAASLLGVVSEESGLVPPGFALDLAADAARVRIGIDPAVIALRKRVVEVEDVDLTPAADVLPNVLSSMLRELPGNAARLGASIRALVDSGNTGHIDEARRVAHTLKGDANTVGVRGLANLTHSLEDALIELLKAPERLDRAVGTILLEAADVVEECADHLLGRGPAPSALARVYQQALDCANALLEGTELESATAVPVESAPAPASPRSSESVAAVTQAAEVAPTPVVQTLAVDTRLLDDLQRLAGELLVLSRQIDQRVAVLTEVERDLRREIEVERGLTAQLDDLVAMRGAALQSAVLQSSAQVDALELDQYNELHTVSRQLIESNSDNLELVRRAARALRDLDPLQMQQQRLNDEIQRAVSRTRTLPFGEIAPRLQRVVRQTSRQVGKDVELSVNGESVAIDAEILERLVEPLSHVLRNAIDHGIESTDVRRAGGKEDTGRITLTVSTAGDSAIVQIRDDGNGLNLPAIRSKAEQIGLIAPGVALGDDAVARLILAPGFSTREAVSQVSGRGVGMDVVNQRVRELRGVLTLHSDAGQGTSVTMRLPLSQTLADVIVVHGHDASMAVVAAAIERIVLLKPEQMSLDDAQQLRMDIDGQSCRAIPLESMFHGQRAQSLPGDQACLGLLLSGITGQRQVLCVSEVAEVTRAVVKPISPLLPQIPAVRGVTQLGDGRLVPVVDAETLLERINSDAQWVLNATGEHLPVLPRIVVADDSLSVRRALEQLMQDAGYEVAAARDGLEALQMIAERPPVAVLLDLEMPRMNGLEVCKYLRSQSETRDLPVIMITSRASDKYRLMAEEAGVTRLLGKPFSEDLLVTLVGELVAEVAEHHGEMLFQ